METLRICLECRTPLTADAPQGLCPACLLKTAMQKTGGSAIGGASSVEPNANPQPGQTFGDYKILRLLGRGGMGEVYEAEHVPSGRRVALKVMGQALTSDEDRKRFLREGRLAAAISHPHVVYIFGSEEIGGRPVIAMELVQGGTLKERLHRKGSLSIFDAVDSTLQIIDGLEAACNAGILHRDIKPANCFVGPDGTVKVGDFGLSISTIARGESLVTASGAVVGTPTYASPEQLRGEELDVRSDIYSVGASLYYLLLGRPPHQAKDLVQLITEVLDKNPPSPRELRVEIPKGLARVIMRCLAKDRAARFPSYAALREALLPFAASAATPATVGWRFVAGTIDDFIGWTPMWVYLVILGFDPVNNVIQSRTASAVMVWLAFQLGYILYYAIPETLWGAAVGKAVCRLRVVGSDRNPPSFARAMGRALIYTGIYPLSMLPLVLVVTATDYRTQLLSGGIGIMDWLWIPLWLALFVTMRRSNGYAAVQDLLTGTRVVERHAAMQRESVRPQSEPLTATPSTRRFGIYNVLGELGAWGNEKLLLGYDESLRRKVWIHVVPPGSPAVSPRRRDISRSGRLRWLNGARSETEAWDAYEAIEGTALLNLRGRRNAWKAVRMWLLDLAEEVDTASADGAIAPLLRLERVWISVGGRAVLLDFPSPGVASAPPMLVAGSDVNAAQQFLAEVANVALDRDTSALPHHAQSFLESLRQQTFQATQVVVGNLNSLAGKLAHISRHRRLASILFWPAVAAVLALVGATMFTFEQKRWDRQWAKEYPELPSLRLSLHAAEAEWNDANLITPFDIHLAGHFGPILADDNFWRRPEVRSLFDRDLRDRARKAARVLPEVSAGDLAKADGQVAQALKTQKTFEAGQVIWLGLGFSWLFLFLVAVVDLAVVLIFRQAMILRPFGMAVVTRRGSEASRLRLFWRAIVAWLPLFVGLPFIGALAFSSSADYGDYGYIFLGILLVIVLAWLGAAILALIWPNRGVADRLSGTTLVPR
jgi:eukaryotic-like serine/threonine-protein kinase